jgi:hypothetical protein
MNPALFLSLVIILAAALPWWPYSAYGRLRHHRPWDWLLDSPSREDKLLFLRLAHETKTAEPARNEELDRAAIREASQRATMKPFDRDAKVFAAMRKQFEESFVRSQRQRGLRESRQSLG